MTGVMQRQLVPADAGCEVTASQDDRFPETMVRRAIAALVPLAGARVKNGDWQRAVQSGVSSF
jgi:hypothetical protein